MSDWIPTTEQMRDGYRYDPEYDYYHPLEAGANVELRGLAFDRWLAQTLREAKAEAWEEGHNAGQHNEHEYRPGRAMDNPYKETK